MRRGGAVERGGGVAIFSVVVCLDMRSAGDVFFVRDGIFFWCCCGGASKEVDGPRLEGRTEVCFNDERIL